MSLILIKTFLAIVETGSLVKASRQLHITQSTVTSRLKSLEEDVGQVLVHRQKSGIMLTAPGHKFRRYAEAMNNMWQQALLETTLPSGMDSMCTLGCVPDLWSNLARPLIRAIRKDHPTTALSLRTGDTVQIEEWLAMGLIDAAITYRSTTQANMSVHQLNPEALGVFSTVKDGRTRFDPNYVYFDAGLEFGRDHASTYTDAGVAKHSFDSAQWCMEYIMDCGGSAYLPKHLAEPHVINGRLYHLDEAPDFFRDRFLITNDTASPAWSWLPGLVNKVAA